MESKIKREFSTITELNKSFVTLNDHTLISIGMVKFDESDPIKIGDIITKYIIDDNENLLEVHYHKEWVINNLATD